MSLFTSTVGRKILMAVSGFFMLMFVVAHLLGNSTIFVGADWLNSYAEHLQDLGPFVWVFRVFMIAVLGLHIFMGVVLSWKNWRASPGKYAVKNRLKITFASNTMIWTGLLLLAFIVYHLLQFTVRVTPDVVMAFDAHDRFDVFLMVVSSMKITAIAAVYIFAMVVLFLHLSHGIQSLFQSIGWNNEKTLPKFNLLSKAISVFFLVGFGAIPVLILAGILAK